MAPFARFSSLPRFLLCACVLTLASQPTLPGEKLPPAKPTDKSAGAKPLIVASIRPLALLARQLLGEQVEVFTLVDAASSPHDFSLTIGQALKLNEAELLLWVAPQFETFLHNTRTLPRSLSMADALGLDASASTDEHQHSGWHLWLSSEKTLRFAEVLAARLQENPRIDSSQLATRLAELKTEVALARAEIQQGLQPWQGRSYAVFHDAFGEFSGEYNLNRSVSLTRVPHQRIGAKQLREQDPALRQAACMLVDQSEKPVAKRYARMFDLPLVDIDLQGTSPQLASYADYMKSIAASFTRCFQAKAVN